MAQSGRAARKKRPEEKPLPSLRERVGNFVFEGQAEHERFGVFDPAVRGLFVVGLLGFEVLGMGSLFEVAGPAAHPLVVVLLVAVGLAAAFGGWKLYRRIWRRPAERELLLQMAREEDEARALSARLKAGEEPNQRRT